MSQIFKKGSRQTVVFVCPFRTGMILNSRELLVDRYSPFQRGILEKLSNHNVGDWMGADMDVRSNGMEIDADTYQGRTVIPRFLIGLKSNAEKLSLWLKNHDIGETLCHETEGVTCRLSEVEVRFYDYGMGCANVTVEIDLEEDLEYDRYARAIEKMGSTLNCLNHLFKEFLDWVRGSIADKYVIRDYSTPYNASDPTLEAFYDLLPKNHGQILWAHRLFILEGGDESFEDGHVEAAMSFIPNDTTDAPNVSNASDVIGYVGYGASIAITRDKGHDVVQKIIDMLHIQNVFYVTIEDMTRHLFYLNNEISRLKEDRTIKELERQSAFIIRYQSQISFFRAIYDDYDNTLDPQSMKVWRAVEKCWDTANRFQDLEYKMSLAERVYDRIMQSLSNMHSKRLGIFVLVFTILSMLSVIVDTVDFTQGEGLDAPNIVRISVLAMMSLMAIILAAILLRSKRL